MAVKKILLFGFDDPPSILAAAAAAKPFGAEVIPVPRSGYGQSLASLAEKGPVPGTPCAPLGERMLVLCGLEKELDALLPALSAAGVGCLKAVLTPRNRSWTAGRLLRELQRERRSLR